MSSRTFHLFTSFQNIFVRINDDNSMVDVRLGPHFAASPSVEVIGDKSLMVWLSGRVLSFEGGCSGSLQQALDALTERISAMMTSTEEVGGFVSETSLSLDKTNLVVDEPPEQRHEEDQERDHDQVEHTESESGSRSGSGSRSDLNMSADSIDYRAVDVMKAPSTEHTGHVTDNTDEVSCQNSTELDGAKSNNISSVVSVVSDGEGGVSKSESVTSIASSSDLISCPPSGDSTPSSTAHTEIDQSEAQSEILEESSLEQHQQQQGQGQEEAQKSGQEVTKEEGEGEDDGFVMI